LSPCFAIPATEINPPKEKGDVRLIRVIGDLLRISSDGG